jgi:hypothetical protein
MEDGFMSMESLNVTRRVGYENLDIQQALGIKYLIGEIQGMPLLDTISRLSSINLLLSNERRDNRSEAKLRASHLNPALQDRVLRFEQQEGLGAVFNRQATLLLIHFARHYASDTVVLKNPTHLDLNLGLFFLIANDFLTFIEDLNFRDEDREYNLKLMAPHITRQYLFHHSAQERYSIPQSWLVFEGLKHQAKAHNFIDISGTLEQSRGFSIEEYYSVLTLLYCYWGRQTFEKWDHNFVVINPKTIFSTIKVPPEKYLRILDSLSVEVRPKQGHPSLKSSVDWRKEIYEQFELRLRPLIKINDVYICSDLEFVKAAFWDGPYHMILTDHPRTPIAKKMMDFLGDTTELFIRAIAKDAFKDRFVDILNKKNNPLGDGVVKVREDWIVIVESKAARPGIEMVSGDKPITELRDFKKLIKDGITQLSDRIWEYRQLDGFQGRITPCLITAGHIPQHEIIWDLIEKELQALSLMSDKGTDFPFVMDLEAWNVVCSAEKAGFSISDILDARYRDRSTKTSSPGYFLFKMMFNDQNREEPPHPELLSLFEDRVQLLTTELFQKQMKKRRSPEGSWKSLFGL